MKPPGRGGPRRLPTPPPSLHGGWRTSDAALKLVSRDASGAVGVAGARCQVRTERQVVDLLRWARAHRVPVVARGAGTSLDGESVPVHGGVVLDLSRMDRVLEVDRTDLWARVQPGVVNYQLQRHLRRLGLFYPPNPGSWETSTIGGNVGTNASGFRSFRYGPTRAWVLGGRAVTGTGEVLTFGTTCWKRSAGPDLLPVLVGSEGTLAVFTELTVRVCPLPPSRFGLLAAVPAAAGLGKVAQGLQEVKGEGISAVEWVDARVARALSRSLPLPSGGEGGALLLEVEGRSHAGRESLQRTWGARLRRWGIPGPVRVFPDADRLWRERGAAGRRLDEEVGPRIREDVGVPLSRWDALLQGVRRLARKHRVELVMYAHLGEGSLHPNFMIEPATARAARLQGELWKIVWSLGGTASAEHGLGSLKASAYSHEHAPGALRAVRALKRELDPAGILNPGKMFG